MRVGPKVNYLKHPFVLTVMIRFKPASQSVAQYHSVVSCAVNMEDLFRTIFCKLVINKYILNVLSVHFTNKSTDYWVTLYLELVAKIAVDHSGSAD
jgi:hypothetical protein